MNKKQDSQTYLQNDISMFSQEMKTYQPQNLAVLKKSFSEMQDEHTQVKEEISNLSTEIDLSILP